MVSTLPLLGIDCGSTTVKMLVMDQAAAVLEKEYRYHLGDPAAAVQDFLSRSGYTEFALVAATSGTPAFIRADHRSENKISFIEGIKSRHPDTRDILLVGSEKFARIIFDPDGSYRRMKANSSCAAGTGSFLDQQAVRLGIAGSAALAELAEQSGPETPHIASRCSVFAKTDLIHAQQEGWGLAEISDGLCSGLARNIADTLFPGETLAGPVVMAGGVALNRRVVKHLSDIAGCAIRSDDLAPYYGVIGALLRAKTAGLAVEHPRRAADILVLVREKRRYAHPPLGEPRGNYPEFRSLAAYNYVSPLLGAANPVETDVYQPLGGTGETLGVHLGVDIGSTSTKVALLDRDRRMLLGCYTRTAGDPIRAVQGLLDALENVEKREGFRFDVLSCATTGSGRKLIGAVIGADGVIDEISAHARAAVELDPAVDTILEIGGQDSKFTVVKDGVVVFSNMNTVCAAGTGSFIEEQAHKLGVPIREYADRATGSPAPATSDRCTVFMERDLNNYQNEGYGVNELLTATLYSICDNYLSKVAVEGAIGANIVFQGATAKNRALVAAFEQRLGKPISVSPFCHLTGAMGAAMQQLDDAGAAPADAARPSRFKGLALSGETIRQRSDVCTGCTNHCKLHIINVQGEDIVYGYLCGRGAGDKNFVSKNRSGFDLLRERNNLLTAAVRTVADKASRKPERPAGLQDRISQAMLSLSTSTFDALNDAMHQATDSALKAAAGKPAEGEAAPDADQVRAALAAISIGLPRALYLQEDAYLWKFFFEQLGFAVVLGDDASKQLAAGKRIAGADFCAPISMVHGQVLSLLDVADYVFLPVYLEAPLKGAEQGRAFYCNYSQYAPTLVAVATEKGDRILRPLIQAAYGSDADAVHELREMFRGVLESRGLPLPPPSLIDKAYAGTKHIKALYAQRLKDLYRKVRPEQHEVAVVLTGRPYTALSRGLNKGIPDMFAQYGLKVFFHDMIPIAESHRQDKELQAYHWYYATKILETAYYTMETPNLYPVLITSFKCGPDSFAMETFKTILDQAHKPYLVLQIDEHDSAVGYETRIEAAVRSFRNHFHALRAKPAGPPAAADVPPPEPTLLRKAGRFGLPKLPTVKIPAFPRAKTVLIPNWDPLVCTLLEAALRGNGIDAHALEETPDLIQEAMTHNTGQCIPVSIIAHETIRYVERHGLDPAKTAIWLIRALWPCNLPLYPLQTETTFKKFGRGMEKIEVYTGDITFFDVSPRMILDAFHSYLLGGLLRKITCRIRPYEVNAGSADAFEAQNLKEIAQALEKHEPITPVIRRIGEGIKAIPQKPGTRPKVAIFGDFYVRDNDIFNQDLIRSIEQAGGEVVVTSYIEYLKATADSFFERLLLERRYAKWAGYRTVLMTIAAVERSLTRQTGVSLSNGTWTNRRRREAFDYFGLRPEMSGENFDNSLKLLKILDEFPDLSLFVQAAPAFCCPSLVTEAMSKAIEQVTGVPVLSITYDGTGGLKNDLVEPYLARYGAATQTAAGKLAEEKAAAVTS